MKKFLSVDKLLPWTTIDWVILRLSKLLSPTQNCASAGRHFEVSRKNLNMRNGINTGTWQGNYGKLGLFHHRGCLERISDWRDEIYLGIFSNIKRLWCLLRDNKFR